MQNPKASSPSPRERRQAARAEIIRRIGALTPKARLDELLAHGDARGLVRAIPVQELYNAVVDVGLSDATEIVQLASPEQFRGFVDLAAWLRDRLDPREVVAWLRAARGEEPAEFLAKVRGLDSELLLYTLTQLVRVHDLEEDPDVDVEGVTLESADGRYLVELQVEGADQATLRSLLMDLMGDGPLEASRMLEALRWELPSELEEESLRWRSARLEDLGFPTREHAQALFAFLPPAAREPLRPTATVGGSAVVPADASVDLVEAAFRGLTDGEREQLSQEVRYLVNCALVAEGAEPGDPPAVRRVSEGARDYLRLGLEHLTQGVSDRAPEVVREHTLRKVFQVGFSLTLELKFQAERLARLPGARRHRVWMMLDEEGAAISALLGPRPRRALRVPGAEPVVFRSRHELADSAAHVTRAEAQVRVFTAWLPDDEAAAAAGLPGVSAEQALCAAVAQAVLDRSRSFRPVPSQRLAELCERLFQPGPQLRAAATESAMAALVDSVPSSDKAAAQALVRRALERLLAELGQAWATGGAIDPKAVSLPVG